MCLSENNMTLLSKSFIVLAGELIVSITKGDDKGGDKWIEEISLTLMMLAAYGMECYSPTHSVPGQFHQGLDPNDI